MNTFVAAEARTTKVRDGIDKTMPRGTPPGAARRAQDVDRGRRPSRGPSRSRSSQLHDSLRRHLYRQAQRTMRSIMDPQSPWIGTSWR